MEKEMRKKIQEKNMEKHDKIYQEMEERNNIVEEKRKLVLMKMAHKEVKILKELEKKKQSEDY